MLRYGWPASALWTGKANDAGHDNCVGRARTRGLRSPCADVVLLDVANSLRAAEREVFGDDVPLQRCQWHKREHAASYRTKPQKILWRRTLQAASAHPLYADAKRALLHVVQELVEVNESAARSLEEGWRKPSRCIASSSSSNSAPASQPLT